MPIFSSLAKGLTALNSGGVTTKTGSPQNVNREHKLEPAGCHDGLSIWLWMVKGLLWNN